MRLLFMYVSTSSTKRAADRRSVTWKTEYTEAAARKAANACFARWNGTQRIIREAVAS